jgi:hypothetical protein
MLEADAPLEELPVDCEDGVVVLLLRTKRKTNQIRARITSPPPPRKIAHIANNAIQLVPETSTKDVVGTGVGVGLTPIENTNALGCDKNPHRNTKVRIKTSNLITKSCNGLLDGR